MELVKDEGNDVKFTIELIKQWGIKNGINTLSSEGQIRLMMEEVLEVEEAYSELKSVLNQHDFIRCTNTDLKPEELKQKENALKDLKMELGDVIITVISACVQNDIDVSECLTLSYNKIRTREGKVINGKYVKESDYHKYE